jgi:hypothetical protein
MQQLAERGAARSFARDLPAPVARRLVARIVAAWDARALSAAVEAPRTDALAAPPVRAASAVAPWRDLVPEATGRGLEEEQRLLLGVSLALARAPMVARGERFAAAVQRWRVAPGKAGGPLPVARSARPRSAARPMPAPAIDEPSIQASPESTDPPDPAASAPAVRSSAAPDHLAQLAAGRGNVQPPASPHAAPEGQPPHPPPRAPRRRRTRPPAATGTPRRLDPPTPQAEPPLARAVDTGYGGVFYLLNLALSLGLYGDFTRPLDRGLALGPWALLELLGPALLGRRDDDPLWPLLARLDGRPPGVPPGRSFRPPRAWRTPPEWLVPFEDVSGPWRWSAASGELRVRHPAGFLAIAVPLRADPAGQLRRELRRLRPDAVVRGGLPREPADPLRRWVGRLAAYAAARLNAAGCPPARVLPAHARVLVSPSHVDVVLDLAALPIEVRFAGLDRTPGWIPAAGRFVAFHFE